jgi:uncharacterized protein (TIGR03118 family)
MVIHPSAIAAPSRSTTPRPGHGRRPRLVAAVGVVSVAGLLAVQAPAQAAPAGPSSAMHKPRGYVQTNVVSDQPGQALLTDPNLVNAWGMSQGASTPLWVSAADAGVATLYRGPVGGSPASIVPLVVSIPNGHPTGQVFNDTTGFTLSNGSPAFFVFASEAGDITAWNPTLVPITSAEVVVPPVAGASFKGLALLHRASGPVLLAADFTGKRIRVYGSAFKPKAMPSWAFKDPTLPASYGPFNVAVLGGKVYVAYAQVNEATGDEVAGNGKGFIDVYAPNGAMLKRLASRNVLNAPWGLAIAPAQFGAWSGDLLVGNFGNGKIHVYDPGSGALLATLRDPAGHDIVIDGLWGLLPGNGVSAAANTVWFSAGPDEESHGLVGTLTSVRFVS